MSIENVHAFMTKAENNSELQEQIARIATLSELTPEALARLAEEVGTPFTAEEFLKVSHEHGESQGDELSEAALENITGGVAGPIYDPNSPIKLQQQLNTYMKSRNFFAE